MRRMFLIGAAWALALAGCSGPRPPIDRDLPATFPTHSAAQILFELSSGEDTLTAFRAKASLAIRAPENSGSFAAELHDRRGDSLFVSISPGLGIEAARALVTPDSFYFYDRLKNRLLYGPLSGASGVLPEPFASEDLFAGLLGLMVPPNDAGWTLEADERYYYLSDPPGGLLFIVDPSIWRVTRYEMRNEDGALIERRTFSEFDEFDGVILPRRLEFERPMDDQRVSLYYRSLRLNPENLRFELDVRSSAERVAVGSQE